MKQDLYQWQENCLRQWFANECRGTVQAATGSGKTLLALTAALRLEQEAGSALRIKIVVPTTALMQQWNRAIKNFLPPDSPQSLIGLRSGGRKPRPDCKYTIYVINSARYELARQILAELREGKPVLLIADECHHYASGQNRLIFDFLPYIRPSEDRFYSMGLSATLPSGPAGHYLSSVLGSKICSYGIREAAALHTVCQYDIFHIGLSLQPDERTEYEELTDRMSVLYGKLLSACPALRTLPQRERFELLQSLSAGTDRTVAQTASLYMNLTYKRRNLVCTASVRPECACSLICCLGLRHKILIFGERIRQADSLFRLLQHRYPEKIGRYHSQLGQQANKNALDRFRSGDIRILIACKAIDEGIDVPDAAIGIILSGTSAQRQKMQRLGRIIRRQEGKDRATLYYLHIAETMEDTCYLPDSEENRIFELEYLPAEKTFSNPSYDQAAAGLLERIKQAQMEKEQEKEILRCLELGRVRTDWLADSHTIETHIRTAGSVRERNYWVCMDKLRKCRLC